MSQIKGSSGCVFCDIGLFRHVGKNGFFHRRANGELVDCALPFTSDNLRPVTEGEGQ